MINTWACEGRVGRGQEPSVIFIIFIIIVLVVVAVELENFPCILLDFIICQNQTAFVSYKLFTLHAKDKEIQHKEREQRHVETRQLSTLQ